MVYQAIVATVDNKPDQTYGGLTENSFKTRFTNRKASFNHPSKRLNTELSKYNWQLKDTKTNFQITWKILKGNSSVILRKMKVNNYVKVNILAGIVNHIDG